MGGVLAVESWCPDDDDGDDDDDNHDHDHGHDHDDDDGDDDDDGGKQVSKKRCPSIAATHCSCRGRQRL